MFGRYENYAESDEEYAGEDQGFGNPYDDSYDEEPSPRASTLAQNASISINNSATLSTLSAKSSKNKDAPSDTRREYVPADFEVQSRSEVKSAKLFSPYKNTEPGYEVVHTSEFQSNQELMANRPKSARPASARPSSSGSISGQKTKPPPQYRLANIPQPKQFPITSSRSTNNILEKNGLSKKQVIQNYLSNVNKHMKKRTIPQNFFKDPEGMYMDLQELRQEVSLLRKENQNLKTLAQKSEADSSKKQKQVEELLR